MIEHIRLRYCLKKKFCFFFYRNSVLSERYICTRCANSLDRVKSLIKTSNLDCCRFGAFFIFFVFSFFINEYFFYCCLWFLHFTPDTQCRRTVNYPAISVRHHNYYYYCYFYAYKKTSKAKAAKTDFFYDCRTRRERPVRGRTDGGGYFRRTTVSAHYTIEQRLTCCRKRISIIAMRFFSRLNISAVTVAAVPSGPRFTPREKKRSFSE